MVGFVSSDKTPNAPLLLDLRNLLKTSCEAFNKVACYFPTFPYMRRQPMSSTRLDGCAFVLNFLASIAMNNDFLFLENYSVLAILL